MLPKISANKHSVAIWVGYALLLLGAPHIIKGDLSVLVLSQVGYLIIACLSYNILLGQGGMLSFGHAVYIGTGSFIAIYALVLLNRGVIAVPVSAIPLLAGFGAAVLAALLGWSTTRKSATAFAMITFGVGELISQLAQMLPRYFGGEGGISANRVTGQSFVLPAVTFGSQMQLYYLIVVYAFASTAAIYAFTLTPLGKILRASKDNAQRVEFFGYDSHKIRYLAFIFASFFAGISGGLAALNFEIVTAEAFSSMRSGAFLLFTFVGGAGWFFGPIIGAVLMAIATVVLSELTEGWLLYLGLFFVLSVIYMPGGIAGFLFAIRRFLVDDFCWRRTAAAAVAVAGTAISLAAMCGFVEMIYRQMGSKATNNQLVYLGIPLDGDRWPDWVILIAVAFIGLALARLAGGRVAKTTWLVGSET